MRQDVKDLTILPAFRGKAKTTVGKFSDSHHLNLVQTTSSKVEFGNKYIVIRRKGGPSTTHDFAAAEFEQ